MVEIIPRPAKKIPKWRRILFHLPLVFLIATIGSYFLLDYLEKSSTITLKELKENLLKLKTPEKEALEKEVFTHQKKIDAFSILLNRHQKPSVFFKFLEETCHPQIWFSELILNSEETQAIISGQAPNFQILGQQSLIFQNQDLIKEIKLSNLGIGKEGGVDFTFTLSFQPEIFK